MGSSDDEVADALDATTDVTTDGESRATDGSPADGNATADDASAGDGPTPVPPEPAPPGTPGTDASDDPAESDDEATADTADAADSSDRATVRITRDVGRYSSRRAGVRPRKRGCRDPSRRERGPAGSAGRRGTARLSPSPEARSALTARATRRSPARIADIGTDEHQRRGQVAPSDGGRVSRRCP